MMQVIVSSAGPSWKAEAGTQHATQWNVEEAVNRNTESGILSNLKYFIAVYY